MGHFDRFILIDIGRRFAEFDRCSTIASGRFIPTFLFHFIIRSETSININPFLKCLRKSIFLAWTHFIFFINISIQPSIFYVPHLLVHKINLLTCFQRRYQIFYDTKLLHPEGLIKYKWNNLGNCKGRYHSLPSTLCCLFISRRTDQSTHSNYLYMPMWNFVG